MHYNNTSWRHICVVFFLLFAQCRRVFFFFLLRGAFLRIIIIIITIIKQQGVKNEKKKKKPPTRPDSTTHARSPVYVVSLLCYYYCINIINYTRHLEIYWREKKKIHRAQCLIFFCWNSDRSDKNELVLRQKQFFYQTSRIRFSCVAFFPLICIPSRLEIIVKTCDFRWTMIIALSKVRARFLKYSGRFRTF